MTTMNPYYANESSVGPVFDVAHFSRFKALKLAVVGFVFAAVVGVAAAYVWNPDWLLPRPPAWFADANQDLKDLAREHPLGLKIGVRVAALFSLMFAAASLSCLINAYSGTYFIRVGEGGLSLRLPDTYFSNFERDLD